MSGSQSMPNLTGWQLDCPWAPRFSCGFISSKHTMKMFWSIKEEMDWNKLWK
ncbi:NADH dehydrogenase (ubiquinone) 1, subcomplex unknown, 1, isoform CRA_b [Mus musculus]|nr:NADH dehydrogenase (ubiquinone) 1, subcomplex unknown, 1, isoform CRA_b [Mus musculus]